MDGYIKSFLYSTPIVFSAILLSLLLGTLISKKIVRMKKNVIVNAVLNSVIFTPHFVFAWLVCELLGGSLFLQKKGLTIVLAYVLKQTPFVVFYLLPVLEKINKEVYDALAVMGAGKLRSFLTADFPRIFPAYAEITVILTSFIYTAYEIPALLGMTYPKFLGVLIFDSYFKYSSEGKTAAIKAMLIFTLGLLAFSAVLLFISNRFRYYVNKEGGIE